MSYVTFTLIEIVCILGIIFWVFCKNMEVNNNHRQINYNNNDRNNRNIQNKNFQKNFNKILEIIYIIINYILLIFFIATMSIISWKKLPKINLTLFILIVLIVVGCIALGMIFYYWINKKDLDQNEKDKIDLIIKIGVIITAVFLSLCIIEEIFLSVSFNQAKEVYSCNVTGTFAPIKVYMGFFAFKQNGNFSQNITASNFTKKIIKTKDRLLNSFDDEDIDNGEYKCYKEFLTESVYGMAYFTFSFTEIICIFGFVFWFKAENGEFYNYEKQNNEQNENDANKNALSDSSKRPNNSSGQVITNNQQNNEIKSQKEEEQSINKNNNNINNLNQNKNDLNKNENNMECPQPNDNLNNVDINYPSKQEVDDNDLSKKYDDALNKEQPKQMFGNLDQNEINNQTLDSKENELHVGQFNLDDSSDRGQFQ